MSNTSIKKVLMSRDGMSADEANSAISEAKDQLNRYIEDGDLISAEDICNEFFGLEPDYIFDLM